LQDSEKALQAPIISRLFALTIAFACGFVSPTRYVSRVLRQLGIVVQKTLPIIDDDFYRMFTRLKSST
jgi:hypothetical protein